jgi:calcineurin-like phosphoesterase
VGAVFSKDKFQQFCQATQKPFLDPVAVGNNLVMRDIMISANDEGQTFSKSMEVLKNEVYGVRTMVGPKDLRMVSNIGTIISNDYAVQAELSQAC